MSVSLLPALQATPCGSRGGRTYTEAHRRAYEKRQDKALAHAREYYNNNAENIRSKRMARYYLKKGINTAQPPVISHSGDDKNDEAK
jgi:hypothetical protein